MDYNINIQPNATAIANYEKYNGILNNIYLSIMIKRGSFFYNRNFGSRLHLLHRAKNTERTQKLAIAYAKEATDWIIEQGKAKTITITTQKQQERLKLLITAQQQNGGIVEFSKFLEVV